MVPDVITVKGEAAERKIRLEDCHNQIEIMDYLEICLSLCCVNYSENINENFGQTTRFQTKNQKKYREMLDDAGSSKLIIA